MPVGVSMNQDTEIKHRTLARGTPGIGRETDKKKAIAKARRRDLCDGDVLCLHSGGGWWRSNKSITPFNCMWIYNYLHFLRLKRYVIAMFSLKIHAGGPFEQRVKIYHPSWIRRVSQRRLPYEGDLTGKRQPG